MFRFCTAAIAVGHYAFASATDIEDVENAGISLLQVAAKKHNQTAGRGGYCAMWGDTHTVESFYGNTPDPQQQGLYTLGQSADGRFNSQMYQCSAWHSTTIGWINALAYDVDGVNIVILPPIMSQISNNGPVYIRANDIETTSASLPWTVPGTDIEIRAHKPPYGFIIKTTGFEARIEMMTSVHPYCYVDTGIRFDANNMPPADANQICTVGPGATPVADDNADWSASLFSNEDHDRICDYCNAYNARSGNAAVRGQGCPKPPPKPPVPPAKTECEDNGCSWTHAQELCNSLEANDVLYNDCLFDFCVECDDDSANHLVEEEEDIHPNPVCAQGSTDCVPGLICNGAVKMNTLTVSQNNLGGVGPDDGAEEIRYVNAAVIDGQTVDLVLTTDGDFITNKPSANGNAGAFGKVNVKCGTEVTVKFSVVNSETGAPVTLDSVALTWYDMDEGKKGKGRATVSTCTASGAVSSTNTELVLANDGGCHSATSSVAGTGKDNPKSPHNLDSLQIARAVTFPYQGVSEFTSTLSLAKGHKGRNFLFAIEPTVACGPETA